MFVHFRQSVCIIFACLNFQFGNGLDRLFLKDELWQAKGSVNDRIIPDIPASVPGGIFSDLMANNAIKDIFYGYGDSNYSWVGLSDWTYSSIFLGKQESSSSSLKDLKGLTVELFGRLWSMLWRGCYLPYPFTLRCPATHCHPKKSKQCELEIINGSLYCR